VHAIELENVTKTFGAQSAVDGLSLRVPVGSVYGFIGPNGSGKTTTLRMIMHIIHADRGRIVVLGGQTCAAANDRVGYLPEERGLYRQMKVVELLRFHSQLKGHAATRAELDGAAQSLDSDPDACQKFGAGMCVVLPQHVAANPDVVAMVNGREVALPVGATVRSAVQAGGEKDPQRVLAQLHVRRLYGGKLVAVEFDRASQDIFGLTLLGGEEISWQ